MTLFMTLRVVHILGALGFFTAMGVELAVLRSFAAASSADQARRALDVLRVNAVIGPLSMLSVLLPGIAMAYTFWGWPFWIDASIVGLVIIAILGASSTRSARTADPADPKVISRMRSSLGRERSFSSALSC